MSEFKQNFTMRIAHLIMVILSVCVLFSILIIPSSAEYLMIQNGSTIQASNLVELQGVNTWSANSTITIPDNVSGWYNISYVSKTQNITDPARIQIHENGILLIESQAGTTTDYVGFIHNFFGKLNTSDTYSYRTKNTNGFGYTSYIDTFHLKYEYVGVPVITSPANNSAQISRTVNVTWNYTGNVQFQASKDSTFATTTINITGEQAYYEYTYETSGLWYYRVRGKDTINNSVTNWNTTEIHIIDTITTIGNSGYNWSQNTVFENTTVDASLPYRIVPGLNFISFNNGSDCSGITALNSSDYTCGGGYFWWNWTNNTFNLITINNSNHTNYELYSGVYIPSYIYNNANVYGNVLRYSNYGNFYHAPRFNSYKWESSLRLGGVGTILQTNATGAELPNNLSELRLMGQISDGFIRGKYWNSGTAIPEYTDNTMLNGSYNSSLSYGLAGVWFRNQTKINFLIGRFVSSGNITKLDGNATTTYDLGKNNTKFIGLNFTGTSALPVIIYISSSNDNINYTDEILLQSNATINTNYYSDNFTGRYIKIRTHLIGYENGFPEINSYNIFSSNISSVSGYVVDSNGNPIQNAKIGYFQNWSLTDSNGHYELLNIPIGNITIVSGKSGYNSTGEILLIDNSSYYIQNFTLSNFSDIIPDKFIDLVDELVPIFLEPFDLYGGYNYSYFPEDNISYGTIDYASHRFVYMAACNEYAIGKNRTPELYERIVSIGNNYSEYINSPPYPTMVTWTIWGQAECYNVMYPYYSNSTKEIINNSLHNFNSSNYSGYYAYDPTQNDSMGNEAYFAAYTDHLIWKNNGGDGRVRDMVVSKHLNWTIGKNGYWVMGETTPNTGYNSFELLLFKDMRDMWGYIPTNSSFNQTISDGINFTVKTYLQDGDMINVGRSEGHTGRAALYGNVASSIGTGSSYRMIDLEYQKINQYRGWRNNTFYTTRSFYSPFASYFGYSSWSSINGVTLYHLSKVSLRYNSSIVEQPINNSIDDFVNSGILKIDSGIYSIVFKALFSERTGIPPLQPGSGVYPLSFYATIQNARNQTLSMMPEITENHGIASTWAPGYGWLGYNETSPDWSNHSYNFITFNNFTKRISGESFNSTYFYNEIYQTKKNNISYGYSNDSIWMNWTNMTMLDGSLFPYYNLSIVRNNDLLNVTYKFNGNGLSNFSLPLSFLVDDNKTKAIRQSSSLTFNFSRGNESVNITNLTGNGITGLNITYTDENAGFNAFGWNNLTYINGNISGTDLSFSYDIKFNTSNVYGYTLNQPPGIWSYSPDTLVSSIIGSSQIFDLELTQNLNTIQWLINNVTQEWDNGTSIGSYTNSTAGLGTHQINATGCNDKGCVTQLWEWTVTELPSTPKNYSTIYLTPIADTQVIQSLPNNIYGANTTMGVRDGATATTPQSGRIYLYYNISAIPDNATIEYAKQYLTTSTVSTSTSASVYHHMNASWSEATYKWANQNCPGINCNATAEYNYTGVNVAGIHNWTVTAMLQNETVSGDDLFGMYIKTPEVGNLGITYYRTKDYSNVSQRPLLEINYSVVTIPDTTAPASITSLTNQTYPSMVNWSWINPTDTDFSHSMIWIDGSFTENISLNYYSVVDLQANSTHNISIRTVDLVGNMNTTWVNQSVTIPYTIPSNSIKNPGFENMSGTQPSNWTFYTNGTATFTNSTPGYSGNNNGTVRIIIEGTNVQLYQNGISLETGKSYRLTFMGMSNTGNDIKVGFINASNYTNLLSRQTINLGTTMAQHTIDFGVSMNSPNSRIVFWLADFDDNGDIFYFDDVSLIESNTPPVPVISYYEILAGSHNVAWDYGSGNTTYFWNKLRTINDVGSWENTSSTSESYFVGSNNPGDWINITVCGVDYSGIVGACLQNNSLAPGVPVVYEYIPSHVHLLTCGLSDSSNGYCTWEYVI